MAFYGKGIKITTGFDLGAKAPLDHRSVVATIAERDALVTGNLAYAGMIVFVEEDKKTYQYDGAAWAAFADAADVSDSAVELGELKNKVGDAAVEQHYEKCEASVEGALEVVADDAEPAEGQVKLADVAGVANVGEHVKLVAAKDATGMFKYIDDADKALKDYIDAADQNLKDQVDAADKDLQDQIDALDVKLGDKGVAAAYVKCEAVDDGALLVVADEAADFDPITQVKAADVVDIAVAGEYVKLVPAVASTGVFKYVDDAVTGLVDSAPEAMDTLKELADAIQAHQDVYEGYVVTVDNKIKEAKDAADAAQADVDALEAVVGTKRVEANEEQGIQAAEPTGIFKEMETFALKADEDAREIFGNNTAIVQEIGGIQKGQVLGDLTVKEVLNKLLFPQVAPQIKLTIYGNGVYEKGQEVTIRGGYIQTTKGSGNINTIGLSKFDKNWRESSVFSYYADGNEKYQKDFVYRFEDEQKTIFPLTVTEDTQFRARIFCNVGGPGGYSQDGDWNSVKFVYPFYVGVCAEDAVIDEALVKGLTKKVHRGITTTSTFTCDNQRIIFAQPKNDTIPRINTIKDSNGFEIIDSFTVMEMQITGLDGTAQDYYVFVNEPSTVTNFKVVFDYENR